MLQAARVAGCARVMVADVDATRLEMAKTLGADAVVHASGAELVSEVLRLTGGRGLYCDVLCEGGGSGAGVAHPSPAASVVQFLAPRVIFAKVL